MAAMAVAGHTLKLAAQHPATTSATAGIAYAHLTTNQALSGEIRRTSPTDLRESGRSGSRLDSFRQILTTSATNAVTATMTATTSIHSAPVAVPRSENGRNIGAPSGTQAFRKPRNHVATASFTKMGRTSSGPAYQ